MLITGTAKEVTLILNSLNREGKITGLVININKTKVMRNSFTLIDPVILDGHPIAGLLLGGSVKSLRQHKMSSSRSLST